MKFSLFPLLRKDSLHAVSCPRSVNPKIYKIYKIYCAIRLKMEYDSSIGFLIRKEV